MYIYFHSLIVYMYRTVNRFFIVNVFIKLSVEIDREDIQLHFEKKINACVCMVLIGYIALCWYFTWSAKTSSIALIYYI